VSMLGYAPLFRWLLLLLARTHTTGFSPALMQAAMIRGRFAELLGQDFLSRREAENLFVVGMFSFLDRLLGTPVPEVLAQLVLPAAVAEALLSREGVYAPVLALVEACEGLDGRAVDFSAPMSMTAEDVNKAHVSAIMWAQNIKM
jgi:c-di-GMP-related signal transduction protein